MIAAFKPGQLKYSFLTVAILTALTSVALTQPVFRSDADAANTIDAAAQPDAHPTDQRAHPPPAADTQLLAQTAVPASKSSPPKSPATAPKPDPAADTSLASAGPKLPNSIPMPLLMQQVSKNIGKKIVSPPGAGNLFVDLYGQEMETIDYPGLLTILKANGLTAFELNGYVSIVQLHDARSQAVPTVVPGKQYPDDQFVSMSIFLKHANAAQLTPVLRPLMPAHSFMSADVRVNSLLLVDTYANVMRIKSIVEELDAPRTQPPAEGPVASGQ